MSSRHSKEMLDRAAPAALGALDGAEAEEFERHLESGCEICAEAFESFKRAAGSLAHAADAVEPRPELRDAVLSRIAAEAELDLTPTFERNGVSFARSGSLPWESSVIRGFDAKVLSRDPERKMVTRLIRLTEAAEIPAHQHVEVEEIFVLEGDLMVDGILMRAGDYCRAEADSVHEVSRSPNGCVFLLVSSEEYRTVEQ